MADPSKCTEDEVNDFHHNSYCCKCGGGTKDEDGKPFNDAVYKVIDVPDFTHSLSDVSCSDELVIIITGYDNNNEVMDDLNSVF